MLIEAWTSIESLRAVDSEPQGDGDDSASGGGRNAARDFHSAHSSNGTHRLTTDVDCRLYREGRGEEARLSYLGMCRSRTGLW